MKKNNFTQNNSNGNFSNNSSGNYSSFYNAKNANNASNSSIANNATNSNNASNSSNSNNANNANFGGSNTTGNSDANSAMSGYASSDIDKFSNMSEDELLNQMFNIARQKKEAGQLTNSDLDSFLATASSVLQPSQKEKLQSLINMIKD